MKIFLFLLIKDNLWRKFFKAKYLKVGHIAMAERHTFGSRFWKAMMKIFLEVYNNMHIKVREEAD